MKLTKFSCLVVVALSIFLVACSGDSGGGISGMNSAPSDVVKEFYTKLDQGQIAPASQLVSRNAVNTPGSLKNSPTEIATDIKSRNGLGSVAIQKDDAGEVVATINYKNGTNETVTCSMVQEDRDWKINSLK